jgi:hypothetical protein
MPGVELLPLNRYVIVGVVPVACLAECPAHHVVCDERVDRMQQGRWQDPDAAAGDLLSRHGVQVSDPPVSDGRAG